MIIIIIIIMEVVVVVVVVVITNILSPDIANGNHWRMGWGTSLKRAP